MEAKDVTRLSWKRVTDWSELPASNVNGYGTCFVNEADVDGFVENLCRDISKQLNIPYELLKAILKAENEAFYALKKRFFRRFIGLGKSSTQLIELENTLRVPDISNIENVDTDDKVSVCFKLFGELSDIEKMEFLQRIGRIKVKIETFTVQT